LSTTFSAEFEDLTYRKVTWRLLPFLFLCFILAYLDRVNVGFAKLQMQEDLGFTETVYGFGAGIFFIGYFLFEVPSNLLLHRLGARLWIARIMIMWGLISASMIVTSGKLSFYVLRFLLGVSEAGFFPGIILYLTYWYPDSRRAKVVASFMTAIALSGAFGGPASGWIMQRMGGVGGLHNWQWLYLMEGLPSVVVGVCVLFYLDDRPSKARWLTSDEQALIARRIAEDLQKKQNQGQARERALDAFKAPQTWLLCAIYFGLVAGTYGITFWLPQIIKDTLTADPWQVGLVAAIPFSVAAISMVLVGQSSDRRNERRFHVAASAMIGALAFALSSSRFVTGWGSIACLTVATAGVLSAVACFWSMPTAILSGTAAAAGIAWINSVGNLAGYASPFVVGSIRDATKSPAHPRGDMSLALLALAASMFVASLLTLYVTSRKAEASPAR
jgi:D-galactonate transporter